jgi:PAS domain S-box-containing protein
LVVDSSTMREVFQWLIIYIGYLLAAKLGLLLAVHAGAVTPIWPPTGIALAALMTWGWRFCIPILLAALTVNYWNETGQHTMRESLALSGWIAVGNTLAPMVACLLLRRWGFDHQFRRFVDVWILFAAAALSALVSAGNGAAALHHFAGVPSQAIASIVATWWVGDALGFVGFAPFLLLRPLAGTTWRDVALPLSISFLVTLVVVWDPWSVHRVMPTTYLTLLPLVWLGVCGGPHAVAIGYVLVAIGLVVATNAGVGPMDTISYDSPLVALACFLALAALLAHLLGVWSQDWQRLLQEAKARASADERFRILFEHSSDAHLLFDETGIIDCNRAAIDMLRYSNKKTVLQLHPAVLSPEFQPDGRRSLAKAQDMDRIARERGHHRFEWMHRRSDGTDIPVEVTLTPVRLVGKDTLLVVWHDLTEQKAAEQAISQARDAAEVALRTKSDFLAIMSHELRTPLNGVIGMTYLLRDSKLGAEQLDQVGIIHTCADHLLTLINDILDFSRLEAGKVDIEGIPCELRRLAREVMAMVRPKADEKGLVFTCTTTDDLPEGIVTDPVRLRQILLNLLSNAVKFTDQGFVSLQLTWKSDRLIASVRDSGIGMDSETVAKLFQPFSQADASMARRFGGTGLGLAISRRLASLMGGTLTVTSSLGQGSVFTLDLPAMPCVPEIHQTRVIPTVNRARTILLVEDNPVNQTVATCMLKRLGHSVEIAEDGQVALDRLQSSGIDLVLMDCQMPVMDGYEVTRRLRDQGKTVPIVAMTANAQDGDREACLEAGMDDYVSKPISLEALAEVIRRIDGKSAHQEPDQLLAAQSSALSGP